MAKITMLAKILLHLNTHLILNTSSFMMALYLFSELDLMCVKYKYLVHTYSTGK